MKNWIISEIDKAKIKELSEAYDLPIFTAMLLVIRGITEKEELIEYFSAEAGLCDPYLLKDMDKAVERIRQAIESNEKICVFGDYDCDGVTSTAILYSYLESQAADVIYYIPDRSSEGYGMNIEAVNKLSEQNVDLIITVDNGISCVNEINHAAGLGIDVVVTDHHKPGNILPSAAAVVDPHRNDDQSPYKDYCGAGLALKLVMALEDDAYFALENYADLASIGTIADLVPLTGENRAIVKTGLEKIRNSERTGLCSLIENSQIKSVTAGNIAFRLAPRVNAAGRLGNVYDALRLFLTEDHDEAEQLAETLSGLNSERQSIENKIYEEICEMIDNSESLKYDSILVVSSMGWNPGVIGIVSSKITERYGKPSIIISESDDICKASGRSIPGFSLVDAVFACSALLEKYGGHPMAAGMSLRRRNIGAFREAINQYALESGKMPLPALNIDCKLNPESVVIDMVHQLQAFEPFGYGNSKPVFALNKLRLERIVPLSGGKHIKLTVSRGKARLNLVRFSTAPEEFPYSEGDTLDFAVSLDINRYQEKDYLSFGIKDIRLSDFDNAGALEEIKLYENYRNGILSPEIEDKLPVRQDFTAIYLFIKKHPRPVYSTDVILGQLEGAKPGAFRLLIVLDILSERGLISYERRCDMLKISTIPVSVKVDLEASPVYKKLKEDIDNVRNQSEVLSGLS